MAAHIGSYGAIPAFSDVSIQAAAEGSPLARVKLNLPQGQYEGEVLNGVPHGQGILIYNARRTIKSYDGEWQNGKKQGKGSAIFNNGSRYEGDFFEDHIQGRGIYEWPDGQKYDGQFVSSKREGWGTSTYPNGDRHEGMWKNDKRIEGYNEEGQPLVALPTTVYDFQDEKVKVAALGALYGLIFCSGLGFVVGFGQSQTFGQETLVGALSGGLAGVLGGGVGRVSFLKLYKPNVQFNEWACRNIGAGVIGLSVGAVAGIGTGAIAALAATLPVPTGMFLGSIGGMASFGAAIPLRGRILNIIPQCCWTRKQVPV